MVRKIFAMVVIVVLAMVVMTGCAKVVSEETYEAPVRIIDTDYDPSYITPMKVGKTTTFITHPADYDVTVEYAGVEYVLDSHADYDAAKEKVGSSMQATIIKTRYDDGTTKIQVTGLVIPE